MIDEWTKRRAAGNSTFAISSVSPPENRTGNKLAKKLT